MKRIDFSISIYSYNKNQIVKYSLGDCSLLEQSLIHQTKEIIEKYFEQFERSKFKFEEFKNYLTQQLKSIFNEDSVNSLKMELSVGNGYIFTIPFMDGENEKGLWFTVSRNPKKCICGSEKHFHKCCGKDI